MDSSSIWADTDGDDADLIVDMGDIDRRARVSPLTCVDIDREDAVVVVTYAGNDRDDAGVIVGIRASSISSHLTSMFTVQW